MKDIRMLLPNMASDSTGAASALFPLNGLSVIHDAAGSMESYITFDEYRELEGNRIGSSHLSHLEAITGDDGILLNKLIQACTQDPPPFIAIIGSPVPFTIGTDLDGIAAEGEYATGIPAFAVNTSGFETYDKGVGKALKGLLEKFTLPPENTDPAAVNLLGATPLDYSSAELEEIKTHLAATGISRINTLTMTDRMEEIRKAAEAGQNLVVSISGLPAARFMKQKFGIPYSIGLPMPEKNPLPRLSPDKKVLILGESVLSKQIARVLQDAGCSALAGITAHDDPEVFPEVPSVRLDTEAAIRAELKKDYFAVVGDPLYQWLLPKESGAIFIARPHRALSSRLYPPEPRTICQLMSKIHEVLT